MSSRAVYYVRETQRRTQSLTITFSTFCVLPEVVVRLAALVELWREENGYDWFAGMSGGEPAVLPTLCLLELYTMSETVRDAPSF